MASLEINQLHKNFGKKTVLKNINLSLDEGDIYALIGRNGAGKTTLIKIMTGLMDTNKGSIIINGYDIAKDAVKAKESFGYVSDNPSGYDFLTGYEFLLFTGRLRNIESHELEKRIKELLDLFPIKDIVNDKIGRYSRGNRQKIAFLASLLSNPKLLIIDEPIVGLDPKSIEIFGKTLKEFAKKGGTVLFTTHILSFGEEYANKYGILEDGEIKKTGKIDKSTKLDKFYSSITEA